MPEHRGQRAPTASPVPFPAPRAKRETFAGLRVSWSAVRAVVAVLALVGVICAGMVSLAGAFGDKASATNLRALDRRHTDDVHQLERSLDRVYLQQRAYVRGTAPHLLLPEEPSR